MQRILMSAIAAIALFTIPSCKEGDEGNDPKTFIVKDSLVNIFPTWESAQPHSQLDKTVFDVVIGDKTFYAASPEEKAKKAAELGKMIQRIYGAEGHFEKGELIVTQDIKNTNPHPKDGISTPIPFGNK